MSDTTGLWAEYGWPNIPELWVTVQAVRCLCHYESFGSCLQLTFVYLDNSMSFLGLSCHLRNSDMKVSCLNLFGSKSLLTYSELIKFGLVRISCSRSKSIS